MKGKPEEPIRYGITPLGLVYLGFFLLMVGGLAGTWILKWIMWLARLLDF